MKWLLGLLNPAGLYIKIGMAVAGVALLGVVVWKIYDAGVQHERLAALKRSVDVLRERNSTNDETRNLSDRDLCLQLGGLPDDCNQL